MTTRVYDNSREHVLDAAERLVATHGVKSLTIAGVAQAGAVSRGGVLYHYPSKEALIAAMLERMIARFENSMTQIAAQDPEEKGRNLRAYVNASFLAEEANPSAMSALLAAIAYRPELLAPFRERLEHWQARTEENADPVTAAVVRSATHALWLKDLLGMNTLSDQLRGEMHEQLVRMTRS